MDQGCTVPLTHHDTSSDGQIISIEVSAKRKVTTDIANWAAQHQQATSADLQMQQKMQRSRFLHQQTPCQGLLKDVNLQGSETEPSTCTKMLAHGLSSALDGVGCTSKQHSRWDGAAQSAI